MRFRQQTNVVADHCTFGFCEISCFFRLIRYNAWPSKCYTCFLIFSGKISGPLSNHPAKQHGNLGHENVTPTQKKNFRAQNFFWRFERGAGISFENSVTFRWPGTVSDRRRKNVNQWCFAVFQRKKNHVILLITPGIRFVVFPTKRKYRLYVIKHVSQNPR